MQERWRRWMGHIFQRSQSNVTQWRCREHEHWSLDWQSFKSYTLTSLLSPLCKPQTCPQALQSRLEYVCHVHGRLEGTMTQNGILKALLSNSCGEKQSLGTWDRLGMRFLLSMHDPQCAQHIKRLVILRKSPPHWLKTHLTFDHSFWRIVSPFCQAFSVPPQWDWPSLWLHA